MRLPDLLRETPYCPVCEGPCKETFERGPYQIGGHMPRVKDYSGDPPPEKPKRKKRPRGKRRRKLEEDRMHRGPKEDR